jgi:phosphoribosylformimino-5-aminoimidazole carboxamide ribotide isomerase
VPQASPAAPTLYPAIDVRGGQAVRLSRGDFAAETAYDADPVDAARRWVDGGASWLHVVDLDGAKDGLPANRAQLARIAELGTPVQTGGGIRSLAAAHAAIEAGVDRVIIGTAALETPELVDELIAELGAEKLIVSLDARGGKATTRGWIETTDRDVLEVARELAARGVQRIVFTDVDRDGLQAGTDVVGLQALLDLDAVDVIASGGIGTLGDLRELAELQHPRLDGVIVGRALYEQNFDVPQALAALGGG